ncbi:MULTISPECIES: hypothetical protein [Peribacillus]|uniref:hypothetical protein n=1 Tax=Peribacillus TaxID=2675229 RepID=UPI001F4D7491|nr:hypothetical protein [Peribacillus sp. Aquil_B1]MCK1981988.1 hypothetical protein [Peribacillus sp. Aquil_B1]
MQILSLMAEEERGRIRKRLDEEIDVVFQNVVVFDRSKAQVAEKFKEVYNLVK